MKQYLAAVAAALLFVGACVGAGYLGNSLKTPVKRTVVHRGPVETIYLVNHDTRDYSNVAIRHDIPAWTKAANGDFSRAWGTPQIRLRLVKHIPAGAVSAVFEKEGPITGALAYHNERRGIPQMIIYTGVSNFYGYSVSQDFTHELFELLADPRINAFDWNDFGPQVDQFYLGAHAVSLPRGALWFREVCDPVEAFSYRIDGVAISDFVKPNWANAQGAGSYDEMGVVKLPFQVLLGGYTNFVIRGRWVSVQFGRNYFSRGERHG